MRLRSLLAAVAVLVAVGSARADTLNTFALSATLTSGTATGTLTLDETTGRFTAASITVAGAGGTTIYSGAPTSQTSATGLSSNVFATGSSGLISFDLALPIASLVGYMGGPVCTLMASCAADATGVQLLGAADLNDATAGTLTLIPVAVTPEPPGLLLLGTGVLVLGTLLKRKAL